MVSCTKTLPHVVMQSPQKDEVTSRVKQMSVTGDYASNGGLVFNSKPNYEIEEEVFRNGTAVDSSSNCNHDNSMTTATVLRGIPRKTRKLSEIAKVSVSIAKMTDRQ